MRDATKLIHAGESVDTGGTPSLTTPIYETSTFVFDSAAEVVKYQEGKSGGYLYSRYENPTLVAVERQLAAVDGAESALLFSSGMAAISTALLTLLEAGDEIVCSAAIYGGTFHIIEDLLHKVGMTGRFVSLDELARPEAMIGPRTRVVWFESPINPTLRCVDVRAVADACRKAGVISAIDNTFASAINQPVLSMGIDLSMQSCTKYLNGHSDVTGGVLSGAAALLAPIARMRRLLGGVLDPQPAYALGRGMKTMPLRIAAHNRNAMAVAQFLETHPAIERVYYPGLASHPDHAIAARQMSGFGGVVTIDVKGGQEGAFRVFDRLELVKRAASLGGVESICSLPILTSQYGLTDDELAKAGVTRGMIRVSIGLEDVADLIADLDQALR
ncbi:MAG TPA: aminotransferase class I/II-fold pyridoxal phosphate-dependent enzyme [Vicinamibacterales bacterium]|nr:aminotransferase class I/II-fold pyridoxal phosphate-dependent enzyme [Vicinamibacterales bacterium]